jgi:hypothetical protein
MSDTLRRRLERLERARPHCTYHPARRWALLNLYVRAAAGEDVTPWRLALETLPPPPATVGYALSATERTQRVLALLCRAARTSREYRDLLALAAQAGLVEPRQAQWMRETGLLTP